MLDTIIGEFYFCSNEHKDTKLMFVSEPNSVYIIRFKFKKLALSACDFIAKFFIWTAIACPIVLALFKKIFVAVTKLTIQGLTSNNNLFL